MFIFLVLTFLLGVFPLKDADIFWHLRTGQLIRQTGSIPRVDIFTYTRADAPWIDLHWLFQVGTSWLHDHGGAPALNLAKCVITTLAVLILLVSGRRDWPLWVAALAWLPALFVLSGRMYVRPETLTLLYLAVFLFVLVRWERSPKLAYLLPIVQVFWVNSQGLFVLGPILVGFALVEAVLKPRNWSGDGRGFRLAALVAVPLTLLACLANPYGIQGALYPLELAQTMRDPIFSQAVAELTPVPEFIRRAGWYNLPLQLHLATMALGALSFLIPVVWKIGTVFSEWRARRKAEEFFEASEVVKRKERSGRAERNRGGKSKPRIRDAKLVTRQGAGMSSGWSLSIFRLLLFAAFSVLSLQATRNTHQFAAVVGAVTAWNFSSWAAELLRRRRARAPEIASSASAPLITAGLVAGLVVFVAMGTFFRLTGEGRVIGLGEEPLFFPHAAARMAGEPDMPARFISFHNAHASLFEYYHGPERKVFTDPRLEVAGARLFQEYTRLEGRIVSNQPGWEGELDTIGRPVVLVDHEYNSGLGANLLGSQSWRCVWFDPSAAVFVHDSFRQTVERREVDFGRRHFEHELDSNTLSTLELHALARAFGGYAMGLGGARPDLSRPFAWLGIDAARRMLAADPRSALAWKILGEVELFREPPVALSPRFRLRYDPVLDLSLLRATFALETALAETPQDFLALTLLRMAYDARQMNEEAGRVLARIARLSPINRAQQAQIARAREERASERYRLEPVREFAPWRNLAELDQQISALLRTGRVEEGASLLETSLLDEGRAWAPLDSAAMLRLHLGDPATARTLWERASDPPSPGLREARIGLASFVLGDFDRARESLNKAIAAEPGLFEAQYALAVLEQDAGNAMASRDAALKAVESASNEADRAASRTLAASVARFAR